MGFFHNDLKKDVCGDYPQKFLPKQLMTGDYLFCQWPHWLEGEGGLYALLEEDEVLFKPFAPEFSEYLQSKGTCGVATDYGGLAAVVIHNTEHFRPVIACLGATCSIRYKKQNAITLLYRLTSGSLLSMGFIRKLDAEQDKVFGGMIAKKRNKVVGSPLVRPVITLLTDEHCIGLKGGVCSEEPIKEISAAPLLCRLNTLALPEPLMMAHYSTGASSTGINDMECRFDAVCRYNHGL